MALGEKLEVIIDRAGGITISVKGVKGKKCLSFTKDLEERLGKVLERRLTTDYYQAESWNELNNKL